MECIAAEGYDPMDYIRWYNVRKLVGRVTLPLTYRLPACSQLRGYDRINAPKSFIKSMEERVRPLGDWTSVLADTPYSLTERCQVR